MALKFRLFQVVLRPKAVICTNQIAPYAFPRKPITLDALCLNKPVKFKAANTNNFK